MNNGALNGNGKNAGQTLPQTREIAPLADAGVAQSEPSRSGNSFTKSDLPSDDEALREAHSKKPELTKKRNEGGALAGAAVLVGLALSAAYFSSNGIPAVESLIGVTHAPAHVAPLASVIVSTPIVKDVEPQLQFLGQFAAVDRVELRARVGGTLTSINFKDGDIVHKGDLLFTIDPLAYEIRLAQASAQLESASARLALADRELSRARMLQGRQVDTVENVDQRAADQRAAQAAVDDARAQIRDAQFDLDHCRITAPFTGRVGTHLVSVGNLIAGSRAATSPTTLLATIVSLDPVHLDFDMSEADYLKFSRNRLGQLGSLADKVEIALSDEKEFTRQGTLDFIDNSLDRSSGTIHARATIPNKHFLLTPGAFARIRVILGAAEPALLVPDAAVFNDQSSRIILTVDADNTVAPKTVEVGDMRNGLRVIRSGLSTSDRVIIDGAILAKPGAKVSASNGTIQEKPDQVVEVNP